MFLVINYHPLLEDIALGQSNILVLFLATVAWWGLRTQHPWCTAASLAILLNTKPHFGLLVFVTWLLGYRAVCARMALPTGLTLVVTLLHFGLPHHLAFGQTILSFSNQHLDWIQNMSVRSFLHKGFVKMGASSACADLLWIASAAGLLILLAIAHSNSQPSHPSRIDRGYGLGVTAAVLLSPFTENHHLVVLLLPLALLLLSDSPSHMSFARRSAFSVTLILLAS